MRDNKSSSGILKKIWFFLGLRERKFFILILLMMFIGSALETLSVGAVMPTIALISDPNVKLNYPIIIRFSEFLNISSPDELILYGVLILGLLFTFKALFMGVLLWFQVKFAFDLQANLSTKLFNLYLRQPYIFFINKNTSELINNTTSEISLFTFQGVLPFMVLILEFCVLLALLFFLIKIEPIGALTIFLFSGLSSGLFYYFTRKKITLWGHERQINDAKKLQHLQQGFAAIREIKLYKREQNFINSFNFHTKKVAHIGHLHNVMQQYPRQWLELIAVISIIFLVLIMLNQGKEIITLLPVVGAFSMAAFRLMPSIVRIIASLQSIRFGLTIINLLDKEFDLRAKGREIVNKSIIPISFKDKVMIKDVSFSYPGSTKKVLNDSNLEFKKGEIIGIVGPSGSGKSTLIDLILGFHKPDKGDITVDGKTILRRIDRWQAIIGYVPQSIYLIDDSIKKNIALGFDDNEIDHKRVLECLSLSQLNSFVNSLPDKISTNVGERGVKISGGQRQRIGIARALYSNPDILVFDESTNSLDSSTARELMQSINKLHRKKTIIIISHQLEFMDSCDVVYELINGQLIKRQSYD